MKILIFYQYFGTPNGGWSTRYYEFAKRWVSAGHEVTIVTAPYYKSDIKANGFVSRQEIEGIKLIVIDAPDSNKDSFIKRALNALKFAIVSKYFALTESHDLVISSSGPITTALPGLLSKWFRSKKLVFEVRDLWPKGGIELGKLNNKLAQKVALSFEKLIYKNSDLVVALSEGMEQGVKEVNSTCQTIVIPNSSDVSLFAINEGVPADFKPEWKDTVNFIYAGSLGFMDECEQIIHGFNLVKNEKVRVFFIGDGAEKNHLQDLVSQYGLEEKVFFLGLMPKRELIKWFHLVHASFVTFKDIPVLHTNSPNKLFDSFAAGIPVIQSTRGWIARLIDRHGAGMNVDPKDPYSMASAIEAIAADPEMAKKMGVEAMSLAQNQFSRDHLSSKLLNRMEQIL